MGPEPGIRARARNVGQIQNSPVEPSGGAGIGVGALSVLESPQPPPMETVLATLLTARGGQSSSSYAGLIMTAPPVVMPTGPVSWMLLPGWRPVMWVRP
jgi:hypothetical protein